MDYPNLNSLLYGEPGAKQYFEALPDYVREQISSRQTGINSFAGLQDYAQSLMQGGSYGSTW